MTTAATPSGRAIRSVAVGDLVRLVLDDLAADPPLTRHGVIVPGQELTEVGYEQWISRAWANALSGAGLAYQRPYDCRHSFASLLLHEGRSVIYVARQMGHSAALTMRTYGHVIEELDEAPRISAEDAIRAARGGEHVRPECVEAD